MWKDHIPSLLRGGIRGRLLLLTIVAALSIVSYAATISVSTTTYQTQYGISYNITGNFAAADNGFNTIASTQAASSLPCAWTTGANCRTGLTVGHFQYQLTLTLNTVPASATTYTVTVKWNQGSGEVTMGTLTVSVPTTATAGQTMTFQFDTGGTSFTTPLSIDVTVA